MQGGDNHASPSVGLQAPVEVLLVVSPLPEDSGTEEDEEAGEELAVVGSTIVGGGWVVETAGEVTTGEGALVVGAAGY